MAYAALGGTQGMTNPIRSKTWEVLLLLRDNPLFMSLEGFGDKAPRRMTTS